jgi:hypothetical protein
MLALVYIFVVLLLNGLGTYGRVIEEIKYPRLKDETLNVIK